MSARKRSIFSRLYNGETDFNFIGRAWRWFVLSGVVILVGVISLLTRGFNLGIEFDGGVSWEVPAGDASVDDVRSAVEDAGLTEATVQSLGSAEGTVIRVEAEEVGDRDRAAVDEAIAEATGTEVEAISFNEVGPSWGDEITEKAIRALIVFLVLVTAYIALRFEWKMAVATLAALFHDILVTVGVYSLAGFPVTPATVIAFLTILGYSIYDGIVVFDRVDENAKKLVVAGDRTYSTMVNDSMNEVLMRTLNTSITALLPISSLLVIGSFVLGATTLQEFALALLIGLLSGAYSSIFIASPVLALLKEREERWRNVRKRVGGDRPRLVPTGAPVQPVAVEGALAEDAAARPAPAPRPTQGVQPRGRKKRRR